MNKNNTTCWKQQLKQVVHTPELLIELLALPKDCLSAAKRAAALFPLRVPRGFIARMKTGDLQDPLLRQVLPLGDEEEIKVGFSMDPNREIQFNPLSGVLHKYVGRVLLLVTGACPINCRFCFRRHFPYADNNPSRAQWQQALDYIASDPSIHEVILSGGEPLLADDFYLFELLERIEAISSVTTVRFHTRMPIMIPERITQELGMMLSKSRLNKVVVLHCNHANEIDHKVKQAFSQLKAANVTILNQSVLLKGVNDHLETLITLNQTLFNSGVLPYYLHRLDRTQGTAHFDIPYEKAQILWEGLRDNLPGYLVPRFVVEEAGKASKTWL